MWYLGPTRYVIRDILLFIRSTSVSHFYRYQRSHSVCLEEINNLEFKIITAVVFVTLSHPGVSVIANSRKA